MAGIKGNKAHANKTSYPNQKRNDRNPKVIYRKLAEVYESAITNQNITSWQSAVLSINWRVTKMDYWCEKIPSFGVYKKEIKQIIISRINDKALKGDFNPTASIWRLKQLGEIDEKILDNKSSDGSMSPKNELTDLSKLSNETLRKIYQELSNEDKSKIDKV